MKIFPTKESKDGVSKLFYDVGKIILVSAILQPIFKLGYNLYFLTVGGAAVMLLFVCGYMIDRMEIRK